MPVLINWKICDNAKECNGILSCPMEVFSWDEVEEKIVINNDKCVGCGTCVDSCMVGAIRLARNEKDYKKIQKEIDDDPRTVTDLFVDRYGAEPIHPAFLIKASVFNREVLESNKTVVVEVFVNDSVKCLLKSIPIRLLFEGREDVKFRKIENDEGTLDKYEIKEYPALLFFQSGKLLAKIEGHFGVDKKDELIEKINKIILKKTSL